LTCSCFNNIKISIEEFLNKNDIKNSSSIFLSEPNLNIIENPLRCKKHNIKFKGFSKFYLNNYCEDCYNYINVAHNNDIIGFDDIKIEVNKIEEIIEKLNDSKEISEELSEEISNINRFIQIMKKLMKIFMKNYQKRKR